MSETMHYIEDSCPLNERIPPFFNDKEILVTGGAGFIGSHLVEVLVGLGSRVTVVDNLSSGSRINLASCLDKINLIEGDISKASFVKELGHFDIIFNEAAVSLLKSFQDPILDLHTNAGGMINILGLARKYDSKIIHASTGSVYGNPAKIPISEDHSISPISPYGTSKLCAEYYCKLYLDLYEIDVTCLRYFNVYGPRQKVSEETGVLPIFISKILSGDPITIFGDGYQTRDFLHVKDCVKANLLAAVANTKGKVINIGGSGDEISIIGLAQLIMKIVGKKTHIIFKEPKPGDIRRLMADISTAKRLIGYTPDIELDVGITDLVDYLRCSK